MPGADARTAFFVSKDIIVKCGLFLYMESNIAGDFLELKS